MHRHEEKIQSIKISLRLLKISLKLRRLLIGHLSNKAPIKKPGFKFRVSCVKGIMTLASRGDQ